MERRDELVKRALEARGKAYAPYSHYRVGAALLTGSGKIYSGCNVENASYGATCCAERVAAFKAISEGERSFVAMAVATSGEEVASPCGCCRQVLYEFAPKMTIYLTDCRGGRVEEVILADLLPKPFGSANLF